MMHAPVLNLSSYLQRRATTPLSCFPVVFDCLTELKNAIKRSQLCPSAHVFHFDHRSGFEILQIHNGQVEDCECERREFEMQGPKCRNPELQE